MINSTVAFSNIDDKTEAFNRIREQIDSKGLKPCFILFFSPVEGFEFFTKQFHKCYKDTVIMGASTYIAFSTLGSSENGISAIAVFDGILCSEGVLTEISTYPMRHAEEVEKAIKKLPDTKNTICIQFASAFGNCEEMVQDTFRSVCEYNRINVVGGTAGGSKIKTKTYVSMNGKVYDEAAVFVMIKNLGGKIFAYKENIYKPSGFFFMATDVDCEERRVYSFDDRPASEVVAEIMKVDPGNPQAIQDSMNLRPLGRLTGKDMYITAQDKVLPDGSITYFSRIYNRTRLAILELDDIDRVWNETAANVKYEIEEPSLTIMVNCYGRTVNFINRGKLEEFSGKLADEYGNYVGLSGFGEQINYEHFNQTMVLAVFE